MRVRQKNPTTAAERYDLAMAVAADVMAGLLNGCRYTDPDGSALTHPMQVLQCLHDNGFVDVDASDEVLITTSAEQRAILDAKIATGARGNA